jgi:predicted transcriptional regulator
MQQRTAIQIRYGQHVTVQHARTIWAALTREPRASIDELRHRTGLARRTCYAAIRLLHDAGYIDAPPFLEGNARRVLIPFYAGPLTIRGKDESQCSS